MQIYISRDGERNGPYDIKDVNTYLKEGILQKTDLACEEGMTEWVTIDKIPGVIIPQKAPSSPTNMSSIQAKSCSREAPPEHGELGGISSPRWFLTLIGLGGVIFIGAVRYNLVPEVISSAHPILITVCTMVLLVIVYLIGISWRKMSNKLDKEMEDEWNNALSESMGFEIIQNPSENSIPHLDHTKFEDSTFLSNWIWSGIVSSQCVYATKNISNARVFISSFLHYGNNIFRHLWTFIFPIPSLIQLVYGRTIIVFKNESWLIPEFKLEPRSFLKFRFLDRFSSTKIAVEGQPTFNQRFILNAHDEEAVSNIFDNKAIRRILASKGLIIEGKGSYLFIYRRWQEFDPNRLEEKAREAIEIFESLGDLSPNAIYGMEEPGN